MTAFKNTNLKIIFPAFNTVYNLLQTHTHTHTHPHPHLHAHAQTNKQTLKYLHRGIFHIKYLTCNKLYVGQIGRNLLLRFHEHIRYIRTNNLAMCVCCVCSGPPTSLWMYTRHSGANNICTEWGICVLSRFLSIYRCVNNGVY